MRQHDERTARRQGETVRRDRQTAGLLVRGLCGLLAACAAIAWPAAARGEHAVIDLRVIGPEGQAEASSDQEPPAGGVNPRPMLAVKARDPLVMQFFLDNVYPHGEVKEVTVRYYVVRTGKLRHKDVPPLNDADVVTQGEVVMNFKPKCRVGARLKFKVPEPGIYMVRVDTLKTQSDHEHFSAIDLQVQ